MNTIIHYKGLIMLLAIVVFVPLLAYRLALAGTVEMWLTEKRERKELETLMIENPDAASWSIPNFRSEEYIHSGVLLGNILSAAEKNKTNVQKYAPYTVSIEDGLVINTAGIVICGRYSDILRTVEAIEKQDHGCKVSSLVFRMVKQGREPARLTATLIMQQLCDTN